ncbi:MAG TPA: prolipoprotein diacylglyceryl transferase family protein [Anaerolineales bacterium]
MQLFSLFIGLGTLSGLLLSGWRAPQKETMRYLDAGLGILFAALIGSRALTVAAGWAYYQGHPSEIIQVWQGGLSGIGALAGAALGMIIIAFAFKFPLGLLSDTFLPLANTLSIAAWLGSWVSGSSYGAPSAAWWALPAYDEMGVLDTHLPVQLLGAIFSMLIALLLDRATQRFPFKGISALLYLFGLSGVIFGFSFLRVDPAQTWQGVRLEAWGAVGLMIFSALLLVVLLLRQVINKRLSPKR